MDRFAILTNRRRALIALAHSIVFLGFSLYGFTSPKPAALFRGSGTALTLSLIAVYVGITGVLVSLAAISRCAHERLYFGLCACSATFGLLRAVFGDAALPAAQYIRVLMLSCAVVVGTSLLRTFSGRVTQDSAAESPTTETRLPGSDPGQSCRRPGEVV